MGKKWGIILTCVSGLFIGLILAFLSAGVDGLKYHLQASQTQARLMQNSIEEFWNATDLKTEHINENVNRYSCQISKKYFLACVNSVASALRPLNKRITLSGEIIHRDVEDDFYLTTERSEKSELYPFEQIYEEGLYNQFDFDLLWKKIIKMSSDKYPSKYLIGLGLNGFYSIQKDPHTYILPLDYFNSVSSSSERSPYFVGLGLDKIGRGFVVNKLVKDSDADRAGLFKSDIILKVNDRVTYDLSSSEMSEILKDPQIKNFKLEVERERRTVSLEIQRSYRVLSYINSQIITSDKKFGHITVSKFSRHSCDLVQNEISNMADQSITGLILDLRDNPGGLLSEAACMAGLFMGENKKIYSIKYFDISKESEDVYSQKEQVYSGPLIVLVNSVSASASELLAGALQEYRRAIIVGSITFGKGTFQEIEPWNDSKKIGLFKTQGFYLLPSGDSPQFYGVTPDIKVDEMKNKKIWQSSEQYNYLNPIKPPQTKGAAKVTILPLQSCKSNYLTSDQDLGLSKSIEILKCSHLMSAVAESYINTTK